MFPSPFPSPMATPDLAALVFCPAYPPVSTLEIAQASAAWVRQGGLPFEDTPRALARIRRSMSATPRRLASWFLHPDPAVAIAATTHTPLWSASRRSIEITEYAYALRVIAEHAAGLWWSPLQDAGPERHRYYGTAGRRSFEALPEMAPSLAEPAAVRALVDHLSTIVQPVLATWVDTPETLRPLLAYGHPEFQRVLAASAGGWTPALVRTFVDHAPQWAEVLAANSTLDPACLETLTTWALAHYVSPDDPRRPAHWPRLAAAPSTWRNFSNASDTLSVLTLPRPVDRATPLDDWTDDARTAQARRDAADAAAPEPVPTHTPPPRVLPRVTLDEATWAVLTDGLPTIASVAADLDVPPPPPHSPQSRAAALRTHVSDCLQALWTTVPHPTKERLIRTRGLNEYCLTHLARLAGGDPVLARAVLDRGNTDNIRTEIAKHAAAVADDAVWAILRTSRSLAVHQAVLATSDRLDRRTESLERLVRAHPEDALNVLRRMTPEVRATFPSSALLPAFVTAPLELRLEALTLLEDMAPSAPTAPPRRRSPTRPRPMAPG